MAAEALLAVTGLEVAGEKGFRLVIDDFAVAPGEVVAIIGANGSGKTTLVESIVGLRARLAGSLALFGERGSPMPATVRRRLGVQLQSATFDPNLTIGEILAMHRAAFAAEDAALKAAFGLPGLATKTFGKCSGGQQQRLNLYLALGAGATLAFLDEPSAGLDADAAAVLRDHVAATDWAGQGRSLVLVTHIDGDAELADRVVWMAAGRIVACGTLQDLIARHLGAERLELQHAATDGPALVARLANHGTARRQRGGRDGGLVTAIYGTTGFAAAAIAATEGIAIDGYAVGRTRCEDLLAAGMAA